MVTTSRLVDVVKWTATLGKGPQNFLGARWVRSVLRRASADKKRLWALRVLSLSPHYFLDPENPKYAGMSNDEYLEAIFESYVESRKEIFDALLANHVRPDSTVIDYGCGPGFLSKLIAENAAQVYGCDISQGALACAGILNSAPNLAFIRATETGMDSIGNTSVDIVFSYAVIQHLSDDTFKLVLETCHQKLKGGGRLILHVQLENEFWRTEQEWREDLSIQGRMKLKYGLHCFAHTSEALRSIVTEAGFHDIQIEDLANFIRNDSDKIPGQAILTASK